jgi:hypothetical protein
MSHPPSSHVSGIHDGFKAPGPRKRGGPSALIRDQIATLGFIRGADVHDKGLESTIQGLRYRVPVDGSAGRCPSIGADRIAVSRSNRR